MNRLANWILIPLTIVMLSCSIARAEPLTEKQETKMKWFQVLTVVDALQTIKIAARPDLIELSPIMGANPSVGTVIAFFTVRNVVHHQVVKRVPQKYKDWFIDIPLVGQGVAVIWNLGNGLGVGL
tara:strand:- start:549 stop:923 length:375 start_codon:yes stop_codon:yes gene_type:complete